MKVLVATVHLDAASSGPRPRRRIHAVDGELVAPVMTSSGAGVDGGFTGLTTGLPAAAARVTELVHVDAGRLRAVIRDGMRIRGELRGLDRHAQDALVEVHAERIAAMCRFLPVGAVVRRDGERWHAAREVAA